MKVALLGYGYWGEKLARVINAFEHFELSMIADVSAERLDIAKLVYPDIRTTPYWLEATTDKDIDAVVIATPIEHHAMHAINALENRKHVLVEKPLATSPHDIRVLSLLANENRCRLMVDHTVCYTPLIHALKNRIRALSPLCKIVTVRQNMAIDQVGKSRGSVLMDLVPHDLAVVDFLLHHRVKTVAACGNNDAISLKLYYETNFPRIVPDAATVEIIANWNGTTRRRDLYCFGYNYFLSFDGIENKTNIELTPPPNMYDEPLMNMLQTFHKLCSKIGTIMHTRTKLNISGARQAYRSSIIMEAAEKSLKSNGKTINVKLSPLEK